MSSTALYRRWRPRTFTDVVGQDHVTDTLRASIREGRIGHAYLFSGPRGTGKTSTARILAKAFNCAKGPTPDPCDACDECRAINDGLSFDVIEIDAASHGGVDDVRVLRENAVLAPANARKKVYIVDEAHMVSTAGWNAFLKTVEEPPEHIVFVFATTEPNKVLPTIVSRCQRFEFRRVSTAAIADHLGKICAEEGIAADPGALGLIARHAEGGVRDALSILDQLAASGSITSDGTHRLLGGAPTDVMFEYTDALASRDAATALRVVSTLVEEGADLRLFVRQVIEHLRGLFVVQRVDDPSDLLDVTDETQGRMTSQAEQVAPAQLVHLMRLFADAQAEMRQQAPPRLAVEMATVRATVPESDATAEAALARIERLERLLDVAGTPQNAEPIAQPSAAPTPDPAPQADAPRARRGRKSAAAPAKKTPETPPPAEPVARHAAADLVDLDKVRRDWPLVLEEVKKVRKSLHALLSEGRPRSLEDGRLQLECRYDFHARSLADANNANVVAEAVRSVMGVSLTIVTTVGDLPVEPEPAAEPAAAPASDDPVDVLSSAFGVEVIEETDAQSGADPVFEGPVQDLIDALRRLPGIGQKSAQRLAFHLLRAPAEEAAALSDAIREAKERVAICTECFNVSEGDRCRYCRDPRRDGTLICVVEEPADIVAVERTQEFRGRYHVLGGHISPMDNVGPDDLHIRELIQRIGLGEVKEIILATNPTVEGEATAIYLANTVKPLGVRVTRIASGLPVGGDLEYADEVTLGRAFEGRREI